MIDYNLAKELKEAGFLQYATYDVARQVKDGVKYPTLSELIEACGDKFDKLELGFYRNKRIGFFAYGYKKRGKSFIRTAAENMPEEAVAKLWLELNKKQ